MNRMGFVAVEIDDGKAWLEAEGHRYGMEGDDAITGVGVIPGIPRCCMPLVLRHYLVNVNQPEYFKQDWYRNSNNEASSTPPQGRRKDSRVTEETETNFIEMEELCETRKTDKQNVKDATEDKRSRKMDKKGEDLSRCQQDNSRAARSPPRQNSRYERKLHCEKGPSGPRQLDQHPLLHYL
ncbi:hypothetical protein Cni_G22395 [Canna indica]|uniref:Uncharacterized protein n=1 Tax=Canna indica TaxID=4628 RepID=A0AAQ3KSE0_9LILI|nr:hypothetical protein Cni_G22395 [Canna indica]